MLLRRFLRDRNAGVAPMLALAALPLFGFVGAAIDYGRAAGVRTDMQAAADGTALMLSKDVSGNSNVDLPSKATSYFNALFTRTGVNGVQVNTAYSTDAGGSAIKITATGSVPTLFMGVMGFSSLALSVTSGVKWGNVRLRVAL